MTIGIDLFESGYSDGSPELPGRTDLFTAVFHFESPAKGQPLEYIDVPKSLNYLERQHTPDTILVTSGSSRYWYWIDSFEEVSVSQEVTRAHVHRAHWLDAVDQLRYASSGSAYMRVTGKLKRSPHAIFSVETSMQPRKWVMDYMLRIKSEDSHSILMAMTRGSNTDETVEYFVWNASWTDASRMSVMLPTRTVQMKAPTLSEIYDGVIQKKFASLGEIVGLWVLPFNMDLPYDYRWGAAGGENPNILISEVDISSWATTTRFVYTLKLDTGTWPKVAQTTISRTFDPKTVDDTHRISIMDPFGQIVGRLPRSKEFGGYFRWVGYLDANATSPGLRMYVFSESDLSQGQDPFDVSVLAAQALEGKAFDIPAIPLPLTKSAYSDYILSGEREYQQKMRDTQALQGLSGIAAGAVSGALIGAAGGMGIGAIPGAVVGAGAGLAGLTTNYFGSKMAQEATEAKIKSQPVSVIQAGGGWEFLKHGNRTWSFVFSEWDPISMAEYAAEVTRRGYECDTSVSELSLIDSTVTSPGKWLQTGGWQFMNPHVESNLLPPETRKAIESILERGVHIK